MRRVFLILLCCFLVGCGLPRLTESSIYSGYSWKIDNEDFYAAPTNVHIGYELNNFLGLENHSGRLELAAEIFVHHVNGSEEGKLMGITPIIRYSYPLYDNYLYTYVEGGAGPGYLSIDTKEQGEAGFNFIDQIGGGIQCYFTPSFGFIFGYRYIHISHAGIRDGRNRGIDMHSIIFGVSFKH